MSEQNGAAAAPHTAAAKPSTKGVPFWAQVLIGLVAGVLLGFAARQFSWAWLTTIMTTVGSIFVQLLRVIVVPLVVTAIIASIANLRHVANATRLAVQTIIWFAITAAISVLIGITIGLLTNPGLNLALSPDAGSAPRTTGSWLDFLKSIIPANILGLEVSSSTTASGSISTSLSFNVLQLVVIGIVVGAAALAVGPKAEPFLIFNRAALEVSSKLVWWVIRLSPIATAALIGKAISSYPWEVIASLGIFTFDVYLGCAIVLFVLYPILAWANGLNPLKFFAGMWPVLQFAFVSRSSIGTLPLTRAATTRNLGVPSEYASFAVPLGSTTKMDGCAAIYPALAAITVAQLFGVELTLTHYLLIAFVSIVGSTATAGMTGATVMLTLTLSTLGLPLEGVGLLLAVDPILDMARTATNVAGQMLVPTIVAKRNGILDQQRYDSNSWRQATDRLGESEDAEVGSAQRTEQRALV